MQYNLCIIGKYNIIVCTPSSMAYVSLIVTNYNYFIFISIHKSLAITDHVFSFIKVLLTVQE